MLAQFTFWNPQLERTRIECLTSHCRNGCREFVARWRSAPKLQSRLNELVEVLLSWAEHTDAPAAGLIATYVSFTQRLLFLPDVHGADCRGAFERR